MRIDFLYCVLLRDCPMQQLGFIRMFCRAITGHLNGAFFMAELHDYRECGRNVEHYDIKAHFNGESIAILLDDECEVFIQMNPEEAKSLILNLQNSIADFKGYAAAI